MNQEIDINKGVKQYQQTPNAKLIDVRGADEFAEGHIDEAINIPLDQIDRISEEVSDKETPLFVYCRSGRRSDMAVEQLKDFGYTNAQNIGGILDYNPEEK